jgi:catechol 2,3-dioxygenase-like lactoylglutathione lyase family enzyme
LLALTSSSQQKTLPISFAINHVGCAVPDVDAASKWYVDTLGFTRLRSTSFTDRADAPEAPIFKIYPPSLRKARIAYLSAGNGVGFELFEFDPKIEAGAEANFDRDYRRGGYFHVAVTTPDLDGMIDRIVSAGGKRIGETTCVYHARACYVSDPWGNVIELLSCSFEQLMSNRG